MSASSVPSESGAAGPPRGGEIVRRHALATRLWHWTNAVTVIVMLMSGLMIFNAHPRLYWGEYGADPDRAWLQIGTSRGRGVLVLGREVYDTTGVLGLWKDPDGREQRRAFPWWATIPSRYSLADARLWHLFFAWLLVAAWLFWTIAGLFDRHIARDLLPRRSELGWRLLAREIGDHLRLRFARGAAALSYNILQKLSYLSVLFGLIPIMILTGLTMSPAVVAGWPWLLDLFGGRQSARSIHFLCALTLVLFILVHLVMVLASGPINGVRAMITGRYRLPPERDA